MPTTEEIKYTDPEIRISKLGIIAGSGTLPSHIIERCHALNITPYIVGFDGQTDPKTMREQHTMRTGLGCVGKVMSFFKEHGVNDITLCGGINRPAWHELKPDWKGIQILSKIGLRALGDNDLLVFLKKELENEGFTLHGAHRFCNKLCIQEGVLGKYAPLESDDTSIQRGIHVSQEIGALDIGQSIVVQSGVILGVEGIEGTDSLISRCAKLQKSGRGAILVKTCKPQQDEDLDMPTIGVQTIKTAHESGFCGIVAHAEKTIILDVDNVVKYADRFKMFIVAMHVNKT